MKCFESIDLIKMLCHRIMERSQSKKHQENLSPHLDNNYIGKICLI